jgi:hypothetical protein
MAMKRPHVTARKFTGSPQRPSEKYPGGASSERHSPRRRASSIGTVTSR